MKILFVGEDWSGSNARELRETLTQDKSISLTTVSIGVIPEVRSIAGKVLNRLLLRFRIGILKSRILAKCSEFRPDVIIIAKGWHFDTSFIRYLRQQVAPVVNIFPDASPHVHGRRLKKAMGEYDLVISTKKFHPPLWKTLYGYSNLCVHVSHGYGSAVHLHTAPNPAPAYDVVMIATARDEYEELVRKIAPRLIERGRKFVLGGAGWRARGLDELGISLIEPQEGKAYMDWLRNGKVVIAPVQTTVRSRDGEQPGDEVSARTFQCAAGFTFFIHRRTPEVKEYYDEKTEVPLYDDAQELFEKIEYYLNVPDARAAMAAAAHARAVPAYSIESRAREVLLHVRALLSARQKQVKVAGPNIAGIE